MSERILIIIPAYNEEKSIRKVVRSISAYNPLYECLVINDGSLDQTQEQAESDGLATVVKLPSNLGIGGAVQTGFKYAFYEGVDFAIQFDGDGQHLAQEIPTILKPLQSGRSDVCIGSRFVEKTQGFQSTFMRRVGIRIFSYMTGILTGKKIYDATSGFRAYNKSAIAFLASHYPTDYPEPETIILLGKNDFRVEEVAVTMAERQGGESSISGFKSAKYMIKVSLAMLMAARRKKVRKVSVC